MNDLKHENVRTGSVSRSGVPRQTPYSFANPGAYSKRITLYPTLSTLSGFLLDRRTFQCCTACREVRLLLGAGAGNQLACQPTITSHSASVPLMVDVTL